MTRIIFAIIAASLLIPSASMAFGEAGRWSSGWGQGVSEYTAVDAKGNSLYIACSEDRPVSMTLTVNNNEYGSYSEKGFGHIIDGSEISMPYETSSRVGAQNFEAVWDGLRKAKSLQAKAEDGKIIDLPVAGSAKTLPSLESPENSCRVDF